MPEKTVTKEVKEVKDETVLEQSDTKRERKSPVRFSIAVTKAAPREFVVPEGKGTPLGQIPSIAADLSKKKIDDPLLMTLHNIAFGKAAKRVHLKTNLRQFRGVVYDDQLDRAKLEQRVSSRSHAVLQKLCGILNLSAGGSSADLVGRIADFLECPTDTQPAKKGNAKSAATKKEAPEDEGKATPKASPKKASPKKASPKKASPKKATPKKTETAEVKPAAKRAKIEKSPAKKTTKKEKSAEEKTKTTSTKKSASKACGKSCKK